MWASRLLTWAVGLSPSPSSSCEGAGHGQIGKAERSLTQTRSCPTQLLPISPSSPTLASDLCALHILAALVALPMPTSSPLCLCSSQHPKSNDWLCVSALCPIDLFTLGTHVWHELLYVRSPDHTELSLSWDLAESLPLEESRGPGLRDCSIKGSGAPWPQRSGQTSTCKGIVGAAPTRTSDHWRALKGQSGHLKALGPAWARL